MRRASRTSRASARVCPCLCSLRFARLGVASLLLAREGARSPDAAVDEFLNAFSAAADQDAIWIAPPHLFVSRGDVGTDIEIGVLE